MSQASASRTIRYLTKSGTYTTILNCPTGDIYQYWTGTESNPAVSYPDLRISQPVLQFIVVSSRAAEGETRPEAVEVFVNEQRALWFDGGGENLSWEGLLTLIKPSEDEDASIADKRWKIQVTNNFVEHDPPFITPLLIRVVGKVNYGTSVDDVEAIYSIKIAQDTGSAPNRVVIVDGDLDLASDNPGHNFIFSSKNQIIKLKAQVQTKDGIDTTGNYIYEWAVAGANPITGATLDEGWQVLSEAGNMISLNERDIVSAAEVRVKVFKNNGGSRGEMIGIDFQTLTDSTDPLMVKANAIPPDETIEEGSGVRNSVSYTPDLVTRDGGIFPDSQQPDFRFILTGPAGVCMYDTTKTHGTSFVVSDYDARQANGDMNLVIMAEDSSTPTA